MRLHGLLGSNELKLGQNDVMLATLLLILVRSGFEIASLDLQTHFRL